MKMEIGALKQLFLNFNAWVVEILSKDNFIVSENYILFDSLPVTNFEVDYNNHKILIVLDVEFNELPKIILSMHIKATQIGLRVSIINENLEEEVSIMSSEELATLLRNQHYLFLEDTL